MYQPYALVIEVSKSFNDTSILKVMYDERFFDHGMAQEFACQISEIVSAIIRNGRQDVAIEEV
jgi:hypothetical protein